MCGYETQLCAHLVPEHEPMGLVSPYWMRPYPHKCVDVHGSGALALVLHYYSLNHLGMRLVHIRVNTCKIMVSQYFNVKKSAPCNKPVKMDKTRLSPIKQVLLQ